jgi:hypothetical protein
VTLRPTNGVGRTIQVSRRVQLGPERGAAALFNPFAVVPGERGTIEVTLGGVATPPGGATRTYLFAVAAA